MNAFVKRLFVAAALAALTAPALAAQPYPDVGHDYHVTYWTADWRQTPPMDQFQAGRLSDRLEGLGAEVRLIGQGVAVDDPEYPTNVVRLASVKYRLAEPRERVTPDPEEARRLQDRLARLGFEVRVTADEPYRGPLSAPDDATPPVPVRLPDHSEWTGTIHQEGRALPARLVLDRTGGELTGELSFESDGRTYRVRVSGTAEDNAISFRSYEAVEGRAYVPCEYRARLEGPAMTGAWDYPPEQLEDSFELTRVEP